MNGDRPERVVNSPMIAIVVGGCLILFGLSSFFIGMFLTYALNSEKVLLPTIMLGGLCALVGCGFFFGGAIAAVSTEIIEEANATSQNANGTDENGPTGYNPPKFKNTFFLTPLLAALLAVLFGFFDDLADFCGGFLIFLPISAFVHLAMLRRSRTLFAPDQKQSTSSTTSP